MFSAAHGLMSGCNSWSDPSFAHMGFHPGLPSAAPPKDVVHETGGLSDLLRLQLSYYDLGELDHFLRLRGYRTWRSILMAQPTDRSVLISQALCYYDALGPLATNHKPSVIIFLNSGSQSVSNHGPFWEESAFSHLFPMHSAWAGHGSWPPPPSGSSTDELETVFP